MAGNDDPASVLEQFCHDVANLPAEITHLMEEMLAKEEKIQEQRNVINQRDGSLQKFIKLNSSLVKNPKEESYSKAIQEAYDQAAALQEEKIAFSEKAAQLLDRQIKRLDIKIRDLQAEGSIGLDHTLPSLLHDSPGNLVERTSSTNTGANTPLQTLSGNTAGGANLASATAVARMVSAAAAGRINPGGAGAGGPNHLLNPSHMSNAAAIAAMTLNRGHREASIGQEAKRRRLNQSLAIPAPPSNLGRQSSLGPGTPKATTPGSRQGSVGPRMAKKVQKKAVPHHMRKKVLKSNKRSRHRHGGRGGSTTGEDDSNASEIDPSDDENASRIGADGAGDDDGMDMDDDSDDTKYCLCNSVSYGNMVGCDNDECKLQWFHWDCVGLTKEPEGDWLCPVCRQMDPKKIIKPKH
ncbi:hypothetical protein NA57DRAFT_44678 [Rhizodiscina lignyota]|uniref:Chromatin modification-related protein n=1 Tax=Rhizodiscina lignyota TaxID=1504668 RepID=A0A9P4I8E5_9PEZI|nr:hypothetical protein NA57DRAFT_44678 [Rhizodiscina lignyota]